MTPPPDGVSASAPGRVNLIGEHTDYHGGFVLPTVIPQHTTVHLQRRRDHRAVAVSTAMPDERLEYEIGGEAAGRGWLDYVQGVTWVLGRDGVRLPGFNLRIESSIALGAGLASSAALEVSLVRALRALLALDIDDVRVARLAQDAETGFVGAPVGIMDQMASSVGRAGEALFLDTHSLAFTRVAIPPAMEVGVIDSGIAHAHATGDYVTRRRESFEAAAALGVEQLRDIGTGALPRVAILPPLLARRARHIVTENARVVAAVEALKAQDGPRLGALFAESHASMRDDYDVSTPEIDSLVALAQQHPEVYGARLTGGGFGGAVVFVARAGRARSAAETICAAYRRETGCAGAVLVPPGSQPEPFDHR